MGTQRTSQKDEEASGEGIDKGTFDKLVVFPFCPGENDKTPIEFDKNTKRAKLDDVLHHSSGQEQRSEFYKKTKCVEFHGVMS